MLPSIFDTLHKNSSVFYGTLKVELDDQMYVAGVVADGAVNVESLLNENLDEAVKADQRK